MVLQKYRKGLSQGKITIRVYILKTTFSKVFKICLLQGKTILKRDY